MTYGCLTNEGWKPDAMKIKENIPRNEKVTAAIFMNGSKYDWIGV